MFRSDELVGQWDRPRFDPKEFMADCFAGALLMPKLAVSKAFAVRGWRMEECARRSRSFIGRRLLRRRVRNVSTPSCGAPSEAITDITGQGPS